MSTLEIIESFITLPLEQSGGMADLMPAMHSTARRMSAPGVKYHLVLTGYPCDRSACFVGIHIPQKDFNLFVNIRKNKIFTPISTAVFREILEKMNSLTK